MTYQPLLPHIIGLHGRWRGGALALATPDERLDWATLDRRANQVANGLIAAGCGSGARVGVVMRNGAAALEVLLGVIKAGAVVAPLNLTVSDAALVGMLTDAGVSAVFASAGETPRLAELSGPAVLRVAAGEAPGWADYAAWRDGHPATDPSPLISRGDLCSLIYSSGTTGRPKGIAHTHGARLDWSHDLAHALKYQANARTLIATGLYSNISWASLLPTLLLGGSLFVRDSFDAGDVLGVIEAEGITHMAMVPVQYQRIVEHPDFPHRHLRSMQMMMCCGSPLQVSLKQKLFDLFPCGVTELYGSTEGLITTLAPEEARGRLASVGRPLPGEDMLILDDASRPLGPGSAGEIVALSRFAMSGYWRNDEATREAFWIDAAGKAWLRSGDIGRIDADGYLFITDRKKDMIISGGQNIYPADIEAVLLQHPDISDCAVFGVPSAKWGETPLALVVLRPGAALAAPALMAWANERLGKQQRLSAVEFRDSLPRNANGKLLKRELRAPYWAEQTGPAGG